MRKKLIFILALAMLLQSGSVSAASESTSAERMTSKSGKTITLRVCNWEEYIDTGDWDPEEETIELEDGSRILGENSMVEDFEDWYYETYGQKVKVEYSTFGTNEDLYNMLTLGDTYDLVCPSEYMFMKLISEQQVQPLSEDFFDSSVEENYYAKGLSPYIRTIFQDSTIDGEPWSRYAAGYMWGVTGIVYNPEVVTEEEAGSWHVLDNAKFRRQVTMKDNVRDSYFAAIGAIKHDLLVDPAFVSDPDYHENLEREMNDVSPETIQAVQDYLQSTKNNLYSLETDSGKADMITGKVVANYQWSGDAVYTMDQADEDDYPLNFAIPEESTNIYFDGWVMLKKGIGQDAAKQQAAEAWINFLSRPDNAIRNMYFIGYTSVISGGDDPRVFEYVDYNYGAEEDEEDIVDYDLNYFFGEDGEGDYTLTVPREQTFRQLFAQYPSTEDIRRSSIMICFDAEQNKAINQMWVNVRCFNIKNTPIWGWILLAIGLVGLGFMIRIRIKGMRKE